MKTIVLGVISATLVGTLLASAQSPADFTGTWKLEPSFSIGVTRAQRRNPIVSIRQDGREIVVQQETAAPPLVYGLDGAESVNASGRTRIVSRSRWDQDRLVTVGTRRWRLLWLPLNSDRYAETRWLTDGGRTMVVEWQAPRQHHPILRKLVFTRVSSSAQARE